MSEFKPRQPAWYRPLYEREWKIAEIVTLSKFTVDVIYMGGWAGNVDHIDVRPRDPLLHGTDKPGTERNDG